MVGAAPLPPPYTILNVDDNEDARSSLSCILQLNGFESWEAATGNEALQLIKRMPDLVILDVVLPDKSGVDVCRQIKRDPSTALTPVMMLSGLAISSDDQVLGLTGGADAYLNKPVPPRIACGPGQGADSHPKSRTGDAGQRSSAARDHREQLRRPCLDGRRRRHQRGQPFVHASRRLFDGRTDRPQCLRFDPRR